EHDPLAQVILLSTSADVARGVADEVETQLAGLSRRDIATTAMASARLIVVNDMATAIDVANDYAPEHLIMQVDDAETYVDAILTAGSVFLGAYTPEALGDYASGTNHVLPTAGAGRAYGGVNVESFQRTMTVQAATQDGLQALGPAVVRLANLEGLDAHAKSISVRLEGEQ
ncbi:MAG: histidinol dehydrogenase, partial [Sphingomonadales bacterium]|nr:histidinol dehydrogenase [Sphingomonadales bacterium]